MTPPCLYRSTTSAPPPLHEPHLSVTEIAQVRRVNVANAKSSRTTYSTPAQVSQFGAIQDWRVLTLIYGCDWDGSVRRLPGLYLMSPLPEQAVRNGIRAEQGLQVGAVEQRVEGFPDWHSGPELLRRALTSPA